MSHILIRGINVMTSKTLKTLTSVIAVILAIAVGWSAVTGNLFVPFIAIVLAIGLTYLFRRRTKEITKDERTALLYQKAAVGTIGLCVPIITLAGIVLFALREYLSPEIATTGYVLGYVACGLFLVYTGLYSYYSRKS